LPVWAFCAVALAFRLLIYRKPPPPPIPIAVAGCVSVRIKNASNTTSKSIVVLLNCILLTETFAFSLWQLGFKVAFEKNRLFPIRIYTFFRVVRV